jgi:phosphoribosyl 1,2-cyclic phosphodiesterase
LRISILASGSSGNAILVTGGSTSLLVDAGLSMKRITRLVAEAGADVRDVEALLVTHEHSDHVGGLGPVARRLAVPVYATAGTHAALDRRLGKHGHRVLVEPGRRLAIGDLTVGAFATSHDGAEPVGYTITDGERTVVIATDLGIVGHMVRRHLRRADCLVLESNHDEKMLVEGPYPWPVKKRILSNVGHLSNAAAAKELSSLGDAPVSVVVLAHLSAENNEPDLARATARAALDRAGRRDVALHVARQDAVVGPIDLCDTVSDVEGAFATCTRSL